MSGPSRELLLRRDKVKDQRIAELTADLDVLGREGDAMSGRLLYIYVAGPLSDMPPQYLANVAAMTAMSRKLIELEFCPINPAADMLEGLMAAAPLTLEQYQRRSMDLLRLLGALERGRAALFVVARKHRNGSISSGVAAEVADAKRLGIPVVHSLAELLALRAEE